MSQAVSLDAESGGGDLFFGALPADQFKIAGHTFCSAAARVAFAGAPNGLTLGLMRQPTNKHDVNAIGVYLTYNNVLGRAVPFRTSLAREQVNFHIGFVPRELAAQLAPRIDGSSKKCWKAKLVNKGDLILELCE